MKLPGRVLALLEKHTRLYKKECLTNPARAKKRKEIVLLIVAHYEERHKVRARPAMYLSRSVRFKGWWRNWRDAGLEHLDDSALIRWCGFPKEVVFELAEELAKDPALHALSPDSRWSKTANLALSPSVDVLDVLVLVLREMATIGYQHQLCTDMGLIPTSVSKYLRVGKQALKRTLQRLPATRFGFFDDPIAMARAAHHALEEQHGQCPRTGILIGFALDGTVSPVHMPADEELKQTYYSTSKHIPGVNTVLLVSPFGTVHAYRACLPGNCPDDTGSLPIFEWLYDPLVNPLRAGVLVDYGLAVYCSSSANALPICRPFMPTKDTPIANPFLAAEAARMSRWVCTCRQYNEWCNGSAKRGFPRWLMKGRVENLPHLMHDMELYLMMYNYRVRRCEWGQVRTVYLAHMQSLFADQGMTYNEVDGSFEAVEERTYPPGSP